MPLNFPASFFCLYSISLCVIICFLVNSFQNLILKVIHTHCFKEGRHTINKKVKKIYVDSPLIQSGISTSNIYVFLKFH